MNNTFESSLARTFCLLFMELSQKLQRNNRQSFKKPEFNGYNVYQNHKQEKIGRNIEPVRYDEYTRSTLDQNRNETYKKISNFKQLNTESQDYIKETEFTERISIPSSRAFTNRINTLESKNEDSNEKVDYNGNFITINAVTPVNNLDKGLEMDRFLEHSKNKTVRNKNN